MDAHAQTHTHSQVCLNNPEDKDEQSSDISTSYRTACVFQSVLPWVFTVEEMVCGVACYCVCLCLSHFLCFLVKKLKTEAWCHAVTHRHTAITIKHTHTNTHANTVDITSKLHFRLRRCSWLLLKFYSILFEWDAKVSLSGSCWRAFNHITWSS